ncbi:MAG: uroporphyrinogen-III C-methyltransferase [Betaproteobacteria bacterium]|nr:uroporphyrinogen-III C-methyltransferase [Betaproteobacteria bacterium]MDE2002524.1 uroporphyrinogen-III C-methyltransferase [Betaproteobacteria bacterium]MDE2209002.1 uroporphyrinogen-III C-methyltransferase [Betaproteobacteria bacterium]MDE2359104.1 uroporphyrinogen-III C-methyltransferase [Betaproteobacteria bacterium]
MTGTVYLVGAGPGAPDLLTLRAARLLARADIVFHDALVHPDTVALATDAIKVAVGKRCGRHATSQRRIERYLVDAAAKHAVVVRLKGGDPMLFGRAQDEIAALEAAGIDYQVVPGVTAALAAAAEIGTPLTLRGQVRSFAFVTPQTGVSQPPSGWAEAARHADGAAVYMGMCEATRVARELIAAGTPAATPVAIVASASLAESNVRYTTLGELPALAARRVAGPVLLLVGPQFRAHPRPARNAGNRAGLQHRGRSPAREVALIA